MLSTAGTIRKKKGITSGGIGGGKEREGTGFFSIASRPTKARSQAQIHSDNSFRTLPRKSFVYESNNSSNNIIIGSTSPSSSSTSPTSSPSLSSAVDDSPTPDRVCAFIFYPFNHFVSFF